MLYTSYMRKIFSFLDMIMKYRVLLPTAGLGTRLGNLSKNVNKALVAVDNKPVISHVIEKFPKDVEIVVALGYKGNLVRDYLQMAHHDLY